MILMIIILNDYNDNNYEIMIIKWCVMNDNDNNNNDNEMIIIIILIMMNKWW